MNIEAIYSDGTSEFRTPMEPKENEQVTLRLRVYRGDDVQAFVVSGDIKITMAYETTVDEFDYYFTRVRLTKDILNYHFELDVEGVHYYYDRFGLSRDYREHYQFSITPDFSTPDWAKGAVMYQILVDRFNNGDTKNDVLTDEYFYIQTHSEKVNDWNRGVANFDVAEFYGGDIEGVRQKLYYLKSLGVEVIYFNPIFVSPSSHKYDIADYDYIDPHLTTIIKDEGNLLPSGDNNNADAGRYKTRVTNKENLEASNEFFAKFVSECHEKGIRVILDGVFNHCGSFNKWLNREKLYTREEGYAYGAYEAKESPYHSFFGFTDDNDGKWPDNGTYEGWWGHDTLPKLNYEGSKELYDYILRIGKKWVSPPYNCDGWRLDVAADLGHSQEFNHQFWKDFRKAVKEANPDAVVLAEHYGDPSSWLQGDQWDTIMNYDAFMEPLSYFLTGMEKHSDEFQANALFDGERFKNTMLHFMARMKTPSLYCAMNQLSNHDHSRFLTRTNHIVGRIAKNGAQAADTNVNKAILKLANMIQMTWPGAPTLYYGDEAGMCGFTDPDNRRTYPWGHADYDLIDFHRDMIMVHKMSYAIRKGSFRFLNCGNGYISFARFTKKEQVIVVINAKDTEVELNIPVWIGGVPEESTLTQVMVTNKLGYSIMPSQVKVSNGNLVCNLSPTSGIVYKREA